MTRVYVDGFIPIFEMPDVLGGISYFRIWNACRAGKIPAKKIGGRWFIAYADLGTVQDFFGIADDKAAGR